jgi:hypothetical protein
VTLTTLSVVQCLTSASTSRFIETSGPAIVRVSPGGAAAAESRGCGPQRLLVRLVLTQQGHGALGDDGAV